MSRSSLLASRVTTARVASFMVPGSVAHVLHVQAEPGEQDALAGGGYVVLERVLDPRRARLQRRSH